MRASLRPHSPMPMHHRSPIAASMRPQHGQRGLHATVVSAARGRSGQPPQPPGSPREVVVGIDLGTTNSCIAVIEGGKPRCIPNAQGSTLTPSVVSFRPDGSVVVGREAKRLATSRPGATYSSVKRLIGRRYDDPLVQQERPRLTYQVGQDEEGAVTLACDAVERGFLYPEEVSAQVLGQLLADAEEFTGREVRKAIISVPAYFNARQREATVDAGKLAGLETIRILREPVAAALAYGLDLKQDQTVLVFDLGGGTFDVSILEVGNGTVEVLSSGGDPHLGGDDWDAAIVDWLKREHLTAGGTRSRSGSGLDLSDQRVQANLRALAEAAKIRLSDADEVTLRIPGGAPGGGPLSVVLTRDKLDELSEDLWRRCRLPLDQACWNAGVDLEEAVGQLEARKRELQSRGVPSWKTETLQPNIVFKRRGPLSKVLLVGGATRMPAVRRFLRNMTGVEVVASLDGSNGAGPGSGDVDPDEAVALGAAVQAGVLQGEVQGLMMMDQWQASLMRALADLKLRGEPAAKGTTGRQPSSSSSSSGGGGASSSSKNSSGDLEERDEAEGMPEGEGQEEEGEGEAGSGPLRELGAGPPGRLQAEMQGSGGPAARRPTKRVLRRQREREARAAAAAAASAEQGPGVGEAGPG